MSDGMLTWVGAMTNVLLSGAGPESDGMLTWVGAMTPASVTRNRTLKSDGMCREARHVATLDLLVEDAPLTWVGAETILA